MKLKIMTSDAIAYVKKNIDMLLDYYKNGDNPEIWIKEKIHKDAFIEVAELEFDDFTLSIDERKPASSDIFNIKLLYTKMKNLNDSFATDERLWAGLTHTVFYDYMQKRWPRNADSKQILHHYFFKLGKPRSYLLNSISRLWWYGKLCYDQGFDDEWSVLNYISHDLNGYGYTFFGSSWPNDERTRHLFMKAIFKCEEDGIVIKRTLFNEALQYTNCLCGIYIVSVCDEDFVISNIYNYIIERKEELEKENVENKNNNIKVTGTDKFDLIIKAINNIGGICSMDELFVAYSNLAKKPLTDPVKQYIEESIEENNPYSPKYKNKPMFYEIIKDNKKMIKVSNDYLANYNIDIRNSFLGKQIDSLENESRLIFNIITATRGNKFVIDDIYNYKQQIQLMYPNIENFEVFIEDNIKKVSDKGLIEKIDSNIYKKSFIIKERKKD